MWAGIKRALALPVFEDDEDRIRTASLLNTVLLSALTVAVLALFSLPLVERPLVGTLVIGAWAVVAIGALLLARSGYVRFAGGLFTLAMWVFSTTLILLSGGIGRSPASAYVTIAILTSLILGGRAVIALAGLSIVAGIGMVYAELNGLLPPMTVYVAPVGRFVGLVVNIVLASVLLNLAGRGIGEALGRARRYAAELEQHREHLEETVEKRTRDLARRARYLEATAGVTRDAAAVLDVQELLSRVVILISEEFGFYHTGVFLLDPTGEWAILQAASSAGGQRMLARGHRLKVGEVGIVGYVTGRGEPRIALDVGADAVYFDNPDLPDTRSEMALPLRARGETIGALDVQSREPRAFSDEDVTVLQTLADQVAMAISNARLFEQMQESLEAERRAYGEVSREAWGKLLRDRPTLGFLRDERGLFPAGELWGPRMETALRTGDAEPGDKDGMTLAVPIKVRGHVIGVIDAHKSEDRGEWMPEQIELLETLSDQLGAALESARLYQDTQRRAARERLTGEVTARMRETLDMDTVLQTAAREMRQALGLHDVTVQLGGLNRIGLVESWEPAEDDRT